jgi:hypothetical protein
MDTESQLERKQILTSLLKTETGLPADLPVINLYLTRTTPSVTKPAI